MLKKFQPSKVVAWAIIAIAVLVTVFPFYWMIRTAITPQADLIAESTRLWPSHPTMINFKRILGLVSVEEAMAAGGSGATINFAIATTNSLIYAGGIAIIQTFFASCGLRFRPFEVPLQKRALCVRHRCAHDPRDLLAPAELRVD